MSNDEYRAEQTERHRCRNLERHEPHIWSYESVEYACDGGEPHNVYGHNWSIVVKPSKLRICSRCWLREDHEEADWPCDAAAEKVARRAGRNTDGE